MPGWLDKAKEAANKATEEAKKLAAAAKNADYKGMLNKTKDMATHAVDEAKKAATNVMKKDAPQPPTQPDIIPKQDNPQGAAYQQPTASVTQQTAAPVQPTTTATTATAPTPTNNNAVIMQKVIQVERLLQEIKSLLK